MSTHCLATTPGTKQCCPRYTTPTSDNGLKKKEEEKVHTHTHTHTFLAAHIFHTHDTLLSRCNWLGAFSHSRRFTQFTDPLLNQCTTREYHLSSISRRRGYAASWKTSSSVSCSSGSLGACRPKSSLRKCQSVELPQAIESLACVHDSLDWSNTVSLPQKKLYRV